MGRNIKARRRLSELYVKGVEVRFDATGGRIGPFEDAPTEDEIVVWVQPPSPLQREQAMREANAAKARATIKVRKEDEESEEYITIKAFLAEMSDETLIEYIIDFSVDTRQQEAQRDVLARDEWKDFVALQDAMRQYEEAGAPEPGTDPEYDKLLAADLKFGEQVYERMVELAEADREAYRLMGRESLEKKALNRRMELVGAQTFMNEYQRQMCFYAVRDIEDHKELFFDTVRELFDMPDEVVMTIQMALAQFIGEAAEAKNSLGAADGSQQSAPPSEPETSEASTPVEQTV